MCVLVSVHVLMCINVSDVYGNLDPLLSVR